MQLRLLLNGEKYYDWHVQSGLWKIHTLVTQNL